MKGGEGEGTPCLVRGGRRGLEAPCVAVGAGGETDIPEEAGYSFEWMELTWQWWLMRDAMVSIEEGVTSREATLAGPRTPSANSPLGPRPAPRTRTW